MDSSSRLALNTSVIYISMLLKILIGFFSIRILLQALGEDDYGISCIVGVMIGTLDILSANMANTSMRFLAHSLGSGNKDIIKKTIDTTIYLHYIISFCTFLILEIGGWLMFEHIIQIPDYRINSAIILWQLSTISACIAIIAVPYEAIINAHEHIWILSIFNILQSILSFICACGIFYFDVGDKLIAFGIYSFLIQLLLRIGKVYYCKKSFDECERIEWKNKDRVYLKKILSFTGWSMFGNLSSMSVTQLRGIIINYFFGVKLNASEGISKTVSNYVNQLSMAIVRAVNPQIIKNEGSGDRNAMLRSVEIGSKYSSFMFALFGVPLIIEMPYILKFWLNSIPEYAIIFCQLTLLEMLIDKFSNQINTAIYAVGDIKQFQIVESTISLLYIPIVIVLFVYDSPPETLYYTIIFITIIKYIDRFYFGNKLVSLSIYSYFKNAILKVVIPMLISIVCCMPFFCYLEMSFMRFSLIVVSYCTPFIILFILIGMSNRERNKWLTLFYKMFYKLKK